MSLLWQSIKWIDCEQATLHAVTIYITEGTCVHENKAQI